MSQALLEKKMEALKKEILNKDTIIKKLISILHRIRMEFMSDDYIYANNMIILAKEERKPIIKSDDKGIEITEEMDAQADALKDEFYFEGEK